MSFIQNLSRAVKNTAPVPQTNQLAFGELFQTPKRGTRTAPLEMYSTQGTLHAIVSHLANDTSAVCWKLYKKSTDNRRRYAYDKKDDRVEITDHPVLRLINQPNPYMTLQEFIERSQQYVDLTGEAFWQVVMNSSDSLPLELWPMRPDRVGIVTDPDNYLAGYNYVTPDGMKIALKKEEVIGLIMPDPMNMYRGVSPVQSILVDLDSAKYAAEWNRNFFKNSANPGGVIEAPARLPDADYLDFMTRWQEQHKGISNAHRVSILEGGMKWIPNSVNMRDMQFAELRDVSATQILQAFGFPRFKLGDVQDVNRATATASEISYARSLIKPRLERIKQAFNNDLLPLFGTMAQGIELDYDSPEPEDEDLELEEKKTNASVLQSLANAAKTLVDAGYDPEEVLKTLDLPPMFHKGPVPLQPVEPPSKSVPLVPLPPIPQEGM